MLLRRADRTRNRKGHPAAQRDESEGRGVSDTSAHLTSILVVFMERSGKLICHFGLLLVSHLWLISGIGDSPATPRSQSPRHLCRHPSPTTPWSSASSAGRWWRGDAVSRGNSSAATSARGATFLEGTPRSAGCEQSPPLVTFLYLWSWTRSLASLASSRAVQHCVD